MTIELTSEQEQLVTNNVNSGEFPDVQSVVNEAFRTLKARNRDLEEVRAKIRHSIAQADRGEFSSRSVPEIIAECNRLWDEGRR